MPRLYTGDKTWRVLKKIQSLGQRWNVYAKGYTSRGATRFRPNPHIVQYIYINYTSQTLGVYLGLFADDTCIYATDRKEDYVLRKLQRGLSAIETSCERWNIKINGDKTQAIYFSHRFRPLEAHLTMNGRNIPFVDHVRYLRYLAEIFEKRITWWLHIEMIVIEAKAFRTVTTIYSLFKS
jgi:hypothetical protein